MSCCRELLLPFCLSLVPVLTIGHRGVVLILVPIVVPAHIKDVVSEVNSIQLCVHKMVIRFNTNMNTRIVIIPMEQIVMERMDSGELVSSNLDFLYQT